MIERAGGTLEEMREIEMRDGTGEMREMRGIKEMRGIEMRDGTEVMRGMRDIEESRESIFPFRETRCRD